MDFINNIDLKAEAARYENIKTEDLVKALKDNHIYLPDFIYRIILLNTFKKHIFDADRIPTYTDEFSYKLRSYDFFSVFLLRKTIEDLSIEIDPREFKNMFMRFYLKNEEKFKANAEEIQKALSESTIDENPTETMAECLDKFDSLFYTPKGYLDGIPLNIVKEAMVETYGTGYLRELGQKYGVDVPKRINKQQLIELVSTRFMLSDDERASLESKSITDILVYSKKKGFKVSSDLKKNDIIEYIIYSLNKYNEDIEKDLFNYDILVDEDLPDAEIKQEEIETTEDSIPVSNEMVDPEPIEEIPVVEEVTEEPTPEEVVAEEPSIEEVPQEETPVEEVPAQDTVVAIEEKVEEAPQEQTAASDLYYDQSVDDEIKDIIKKYYAKKSKKDNTTRLIFAIAFIIVLAGLAYFALKYYGVF